MTLLSRWSWWSVGRYHCMRSLRMATEGRMMDFSAIIFHCWRMRILAAGSFRNDIMRREAFWSLFKTQGALLIYLNWLRVLRFNRDRSQREGHLRFSHQVSCQASILRTRNVFGYWVNEFCSWVSELVLNIYPTTTAMITPQKKLGITWNFLKKILQKTITRSSNAITRIADQSWFTTVRSKKVTAPGSF
jgi:hypothetical protein